MAKPCWYVETNLQPHDDESRTKRALFGLPNSVGGRARRSVEYKIKRDIPDYLVQERLPSELTINDEV